MNEARIEIRKADNGFIITEVYFEDLNEDGNKTFNEYDEVIEGEEDKKETLKRLLEMVADKCGYTYDKYGKENLRISFDGKGHKITEEEEKPHNFGGGIEGL